MNDEIIEISKMDGEIKELYLKFIETHFLFRCIEEKRVVLRDNLLKMLVKKGLKGRLKLLDDINKLITNFTWYDPNEHNPEGRYTEIRPTPYSKIKEKTIIKRERKINYHDILDRIRENRTKVIEKEN